MTWNRLKTLTGATARKLEPYFAVLGRGANALAARPRPGHDGLPKTAKYGASKSSGMYTVVEDPLPPPAPKC